MAFIAFMHDETDRFYNFIHFIVKAKCLTDIFILISSQLKRLNELDV